jgi:small subunit ribosomal protein S4
MEKQKIRYTYGVTERQLRRYMVEAQRNPNATGSECLRFLERRLDNVVYRFGFAPTRAAARQFVNHGHVLVNNKRVTISSYRVAVGDVIALSQRIYDTSEVKKLVSDETRRPPSWMQKQAGVGTIRRLPDRGDIDGVFDEHLVVEFYSR